MQDFRKITAWQKSHSLALMVYAKTTNFPSRELFGLTSQMRRAAISIAGNIAEGRCRGGDREFGRFLRVALGSAGELEYYVILASDLTLLSEADSKCMADAVIEVERLLAGLIRKLKAVEPLGGSRLIRTS